MIYSKPQHTNYARTKIDHFYREDETTAIESLLNSFHFSDQSSHNIQRIAYQLVSEVRKAGNKTGGLDAFLYRYDLTSEEGIALMCLAEALLRIPDTKTV